MKRKLKIFQQLGKFSKKKTKKNTKKNKKQ